MGDFIKYLYSQFILRDFLSFIVPGAIVVYVATYVLYPSIFDKPIHWLFYILIFGLCYMVGFAVQCFGELLGIIRFTPYAEKNRQKRWRMFYCNFDKDYDKRSESLDEAADASNIWWWKEEKELSKFFEAVEKYEKDEEHDAGVRQGHERRVALKHMGGNGFMAFCIAGVFIAVNLCLVHFCHNTTICTITRIALGALLVIVLIGSLFWGHRVHMLKQYTRERVFMDERSKNIGN